MDDVVEIGYSLDPSGYITGVNQIDQANQRLQASTTGIVTSTTAMQKAMSMVTPSRAAAAGMVLLAHQAAGAEQRLSGLEARTTVTNASFGKLSSTVRQLARDMPIGQSGSLEIVNTVTQMGVASEGSEKKVAALSKVIGNLSGANSEPLGVMARSMIDLSRATGNLNLDEKRFKNLGDSLTTVSSQGGASASAVAQFAKAISPMSQAAGIGSTSILGIATAFSRMGDDGIGATTAFSKMIGDLNRSVREGSPELRTYADIANMTAENFEKLFKSDPAKAISKITTAVAEGGVEGPRMLERIGVEGIRGQRYMQQLAASGGLQSAIETAQKGYGSNSTEKAAEVAYQGLNDTLTKTKESAKQLSEAFGRPLLGPLTEFSEMIGGITNVAGKLVGSGPGQAILSTVIGAGALAGAGKFVAGPVGTYAVGRQMATSGIFKALAGGYATGRGLSPGDSRMARFGRTMMERDVATGLLVDTDGIPTGDRKAATATSRMWDTLFNVGANLGEIRSGAAAGGNPEGAPGKLARARGMGLGLGLTTVDLASNMAYTQVKDAFTEDPYQRTSKFAFLGGRRNVAGVDAAKAAWEEGKDLGNIKRASEASRAWLNEIDLTTTTVSKTMVDKAGIMRKTNEAFADAAKTSVSGSKIALDTLATGMEASSIRLKDVSRLNAYGDTTAAAARAAGSVGRGAAGAATDLTKLAGSAGMALLGSGTGMAMLGLGAAGVAGWGVHKAFQQREEWIEGNRSGADRDIYASINAYRDRAGIAGQSKTYKEIAESQRADLSESSGIKGWASTRTVTDEDLVAARTDDREDVTTYKGTAAQVAAQIEAGNQMGMTPEELQEVKLDVLSQFDDAKSQEIMNLLPGYLESGGGTQDPATLRNAQRTALSRLPSQAVSPDTAFEASSGVSKWLMKPQQPQYVGSAISQSGVDTETLEQMRAGVEQRMARVEGSPMYEEQERQKGYNALIQETIDTGNEAAFNYLSSKIATSFDEDLADKTWSMAQADNEFGGDFLAMVAAHPDADSLRMRRDSAREQGAGFNIRETGGIEYEPVQSMVDQQITEKSDWLGVIFDKTRKTDAGLTRGKAQSLMDESVNAPGDLEARRRAINETVLASERSGMSLTKLSNSALQAASAVDTTREEFDRLVGIYEKSQRKQAAVNVMTGDASEARVASFTEARNRAKLTGRTPEIEKLRQSGEEDLIDQMAGMQQQMVQRLQVQRDYEKQVTRSNRDFNISRSRSQYDFNLQMGRAEEDFGRNRWRTQRDYNIQMARAERDFGIQRARANEEYRIGVARAERDYNIQRSRSIEDFSRQEKRTLEDFRISTSRAIRDFGISLKRQLEDAAKSMISAFSRIQAKPTWDANALSGNIQEQAAAMKEQASNLEQLRKSGLSSTAIRQLDLTSFDNHQQVRQLVNDISPETIKQLNSSVSAKEKAAKSLFQDKDNTELARSKEDFERSMKDQEADLKKSLTRGRDDFNRSLVRGRDDFRRSMSDQRSDFNRSMKHQASDFTRSLKDQNKDFKTALADQRREFNISQSRQRTDFNTSMKRQWADFRTQLSDMHQDIKDADKQIGGTLEELTKQYNRAIHGQTVNWGKIIKTDAKNFGRDMKTTIVPLYEEIFGALGINKKDISKLAGNGGTSSGGSQMGRSSKYGTNVPLAEGGPVPGWSPHPKADNIPALLTAGEYVTNVDATRHYGVDLMHKINNKMIDRDELVRLASADKGRRVDSVGDVALLPGDGVLRRASGGYTYPSMVAWAKQNIPGAIITSTKRNWGTGSYHDTGKAIDLDGSTSFLRDAAQKIVKTFGNAITELIHNPHTSIKHGKHVSPSYWGASTWAKHGGANEHLHWAMASMGKGSPLLGLSLAGGGGLIDTSKLEAAFDKLGKKNTSPVYQMLLGKIRTATMDNLEQLAGEAGFNSSGTGVDRWKGVVLQALRIMNQPQSLLGSVLRRMNQESSGNPSIVNRWDSNWHAGTPSVGLMQVIGPTYRANKHPQYDKGPYLYGVSTNPLANTLASMRYAMGRYGSLTNAYNRAGGYDDGGVIHPGSTLVQNDSGKPEALLNNQQWSDIHHLATLAGQMITKTDLQGIKASHGAPIVINNNQRITYDQRNDFSDAKITVQSNDPDEMARKLEERQRRSRLTATRGVQRRD